MNLTVIQRFFVANILTVCYSVLVLFKFLLIFLRNPLRNPWQQKLVLVPPARLSDPKYGVHKYVKANNIKLHYVESGDPNKPLMLFLHGFPEFWYSWRHQIVEFNKDYWCIAFDMRGYGDSERPEEVSAYKIDLLVEDVRDLMRKLGRSKCILVSHDWGGMVATKFRDTHPDSLDALIVLSSASREAGSHELWNNPEQKKKSWYMLLYRMPKIPELMFQMNDLQIFDMLMKRRENYVDDNDIECYKYWFRKQDVREMYMLLYRMPKIPELMFQMNDLQIFDTLMRRRENYVDNNDIECYKYWFRKQGALTPPINYYRANFQLTFPDKYKDENVPMIVANGEKDPYIATSTLERMKAEYKYIETVLVEDAYHFLQQESPEKVNKIIRDFLLKNKL
ncbi:Epoxide hydrolase 3 [Papilio machaon]|uniref:Epoxide hydrolase 3 n=1 Tax=Papilio machaon TaxID=76193 RepID=A0A194R4S5_PAPMA|nr:Epoxide hydrolase 3 [Papilio machaon]